MKKIWHIWELKELRKKYKHQAEKLEKLNNYIHTLEQYHYHEFDFEGIDNSGFHFVPCKECGTVSWMQVNVDDVYDIIHEEYSTVGLG